MMNGTREGMNFTHLT